MIVWELRVNDDEAAALRALLGRVEPRTTLERKVLLHILHGEFGRREPRTPGV